MRDDETPAWLLAAHSRSRRRCRHSCLPGAARGRIGGGPGRPAQPHPGTYTIYFTSGSLFRTCTGRFTRGASYWRVKQRAIFVAPPRFTVATLIIFAVRGGNAPTTPISPKGFPAP